VQENLSNWYVRLSRKRFWGGDYDSDKISAYQTLYTCLEVVSKLAADHPVLYRPPVPRPEHRYRPQQGRICSSHQLPGIQPGTMDVDLEERMALAQRVSSLVLGLRRKVNIKVRQPLQKIMVPVLNERFGAQLRSVAEIIKAEINVKEISFLDDTSGILVKRIKPNFKLLGKNLASR
jgi:isoleucyl-tRNA synthetase